MINGISDGSGGTNDPHLTNPLCAHRVDVRIVLVDPGHVDRANIGVRRDVVLCEVVVHVVAEARIQNALLM